MKSKITVQLCRVANSDGEEVNFLELTTEEHPSGIRLLGKKQPDGSRADGLKMVEFLKSIKDWRERIVYGESEYGAYAHIDMVERETIEI